MSDTQTLLSKIAALRRQLQQAQGLAQEAGSLVQANPTEQTWRLEQQVQGGAQRTHLLNDAVRQLAGDATSVSDARLPRLLTARARRALTRGKELLDQLRALAEEPLLQRDPADPHAVLYREAAAMAETAVRMVQAFPDAPSAQLRLGEGLEAILHLIGQRVATLVAGVSRRRQESARMSRLAGLLTQLHSGQTPDLPSLIELAGELLTDAQQSQPLRFHDAAAALPDVAHFVAAHCLTVAQIMARLVRHDPELRGQPLEPVLAALVHDVGMLAVPAAVLGHPGPLDEDQRRLIERHTLSGAEAAKRLVPESSWLAEAAGCHHERLDGTGYPAGLRDQQISPLVRLLAVCSTYAALSTPRPHRRALDPRAALTDTLLLAEQGALDANHAERLLQLSFYPVGSVVELADGAVGVVVATHQNRRDLSTPARPVLALLTDAEGRILPSPEHLDLAQCDTRSIVRALPAVERRAILGSRYPEWAGSW